MSLAHRFVQIHTLTVYGPNNLNRDDLSRPKTAMLGSAQRLRLSSQCVKRAWRLSDVMAEVATGKRTRRLWTDLAEQFGLDYPMETVIAHIAPLRLALENVKTEAEDEAAEGDKPTKGKAGKAKGKGGVLTAEDLKGTMYFFHDSEIAAVRTALEASLQAGQPLDAKGAEALVSNLPASADVAMFGRMVAAKKSLNVEAAVQVAHQITTHRAQIEDDFFVACDDLTDTTSDEAGTSHMGVAAFGSGLYYGYVNVDVHKLVKNLGGDVELAKRALTSLIRAVTTVAPSAKQNTYACHSLASYARVEVGNAQPRALTEAFFKAAKGDDILGESISALRAKAAGITRAYPSQAVIAAEMDRHADTGTEDDLVNLALAALAE